MKTHGIIILLSILLVCNSSIAQKLVKQETKIEKADEDGNTYQWLKYVYVIGKDTLEAAYDLNKKRITPNGIRVLYNGGGIFSVKTNHCNNGGIHVCTAYNTNGECVISDSKCFTEFLYEGDGYVLAWTIDKNSYGEIAYTKAAIYKTDGSCIIPKELGYNLTYYSSDIQQFVCEIEKKGGGSIFHYYSLDGRYYVEGERLSIDEFNKKKKPAPYRKNTSFTETDMVSTPSGLLYKGEYTWGSQARVNGNLISGGMSNTSTIVIYEDYLESETFGLSRHKYSKTLSNGTRVYVGTYGFGEESTIYVTSSFNLRMVVQNAPNQWGAQTTEYNFSKGKSFMYEYEDKGGGYSPSTSGGNNNNNSSNTTKQKKWCTHCGHSGRCATCNGKHWYYFAGEKITCPNCKPDGACTWCNGTGER